MLSLCNMLIVNFVPLPNFGEINIDKNFSFIYLICLCLLGPARARHNPRVTKYGHHHSPPLSLSSGPRHQAPAPAGRGKQDDLRATSGSCRLSPPRARAAPQLQRDSWLETCGCGNTSPAIARCWLHIVQYSAPCACCGFKYAFHLNYTNLTKSN